MTKEKEISFIKKEVETIISTLDKRESYNTQVIEELDKLLNLSKYGSVSHVTKLVRLSTMRNYKLRLSEVIEAFKQLTDMQSVDTLKGYIVNIIKDSKDQLKNSSDALNTAEVFGNEYIKNEILVKTYKELSDLYSEVDDFLKQIKEKFTEPVETPSMKEAFADDSIPKKPTEVKPPKKETA